MSNKNLPSADADDVKLVAASPEELRTTWQYNSAEWQGPLPLEAYLRREEHLLDQDLTREGGLTSWILVHEPQSGESRTILCACETIKKRALLASNGQVREAICHGVASVFCPTENRGKRYAGKMIQELAKKIKDWQPDEHKVLLSILFSDIGKTFYAAHGWKPFESSHIHLPALATETRANVRLLTADDLPQLCEEDTQLLRKQLEDGSNSSFTTVAITPDFRTIRWHHARAEFFAKELLGKDISHKGAIVELSDGRRAWCYWQHNWSKLESSPDNKLYILRIVVPDTNKTQEPEATDADLLEPLLAAAQAEAAAWGLHCVELWSPSSDIKVAAKRLDPEVQEVHRESNSITSLLWFGEDDWQSVKWTCNERYAWC